MHLLVKLDRFLEREPLRHDFLVFDRDHLIAHICWHSLFQRLLLILEARIAGTKWIHLVALANLEAQRFHLILKQLVVDVGTGARVHPDLF